MKIIFNKFLDRYLNGLTAVCLVTGWGISGCLEPHALPEEKTPLPSADGGVLEPLETLFVSYKDVRDIFDRQHCTVCHMDAKKLDLRRYPFNWQGVPLTPDHEMSKKILQQLTGKHDPEEGLLPLKAEDQERLETWRSQGLKTDGPSPLKSGR
jgi:hypothetical protein